jgi:hypothetical protein
LKSIIIPLLAAVSFGCATDPNKQMRAADADHAADVSATNKDKTTMEARQAEDHAALDSAHAKQDAGMDKRVADDAAKFDEKKDVAEASFVEARRTFKAAALGRIEVVDAKAAALETKRVMKHLVEPGIAVLRTRCATMKTSVAGLDNVKDAKWFATQKELDAGIADLEKEAHEIELRTKGSDS